MLFWKPSEKARSTKCNYLHQRCDVAVGTTKNEHWLNHSLQHTSSECCLHSRNNTTENVLRIIYIPSRKRKIYYILIIKVASGRVQRCSQSLWSCCCLQRNDTLHGKCKYTKYKTLRSELFTPVVTTHICCKCDM